MKTQKNKAGLYHYKTNDRWKWMAGATAATAAGVTTSQAGMITVTLSNNYISSSAGNHLNPDLTGDGHKDVSMSGRTSEIGIFPTDYQVTAAFEFFGRPSGSARGRHDRYSDGASVNTARVGGLAGRETNAPVYVTSTLAITFSGDPDINDGATTPGTLGVTASAGRGFAEVQLDNYTYNNTVPDQGSTLALLALGAGGVIAFRQRRKAA